MVVPELKTEKATTWYVTAKRKESPEIAEARYSAWRPAPPADPDYLRRIKRIRWEKGLAAVFIPVAWVALFNIATRAPNDLFFLLMPMAMTASASIWWRVCTRRAPRDLSYLLDLPPVCPQFPVEIKYEVEGETYGRDEGIVSFVNDWLHFQGSRTSWSMRGCDATSPVSKQKGVSTRNPLRQFEWQNNSVKYRVSFMPMDRLDGLGFGLQKAFHSALASWAKSEPMSPQVGRTRRFSNSTWEKPGVASRILSDTKPSGSAIWPPIHAEPGYVIVSQD